MTLWRFSQPKLKYSVPAATELCLKENLPAVSFYLRVYSQSTLGIIPHILEWKKNENTAYNNERPYFFNKDESTSFKHYFADKT